MSTNGFIDKTNISIFNTEYRDLNAWKLVPFYTKIILKILNFEEYVEDIFKETIIIM